MLALPPTRLAVQTAVLLPLAFAPLPLDPLAPVHQPLERIEVTDPSQAQGLVVEIYKPRGDGPYGAMVTVLGAVLPETRHDPRVVRIARGVARQGVVVMVVESLRLNREEMVAADIDNMVEAFRYLRGQPYVDQAKVGFVGFSVGGALALLAAQDQRISGDVAFVAAFGAYYDLSELIRAVTTGTDGRGRPWSPNRKTVSVLRRSVIATLEDAADRRLLSGALLTNDPAPMPPGLSPGGRAAYELLANRDPGRTDELLGRLSPQSRQALARLSPASSIGQLQAELFVIGTRSDDLIPFTESEALAAAIAGRGRLHYADLGLFRHVDATLPKNLFTLSLDVARLYAQVYLLVWRAG
ncbi:MAG TPA: dienelactone hydrolase family protein [Dehalococcoidia bacterium]|nr:dienelactone hydrolase family protein [Dehalococcoidia bacterium]